MTKTLICLGSMIAVLALAPTASVAAQLQGASGGEFGPTLSDRFAGKKEIARLEDPDPARPFMPQPRNDEPRPGPRAFAGDAQWTRGSAIVAPTGGAVMTSKQRADREIRSVIRRLR